MILLKDFRQICDKMSITRRHYETSLPEVGRSREYIRTLVMKKKKKKKKTENENENVHYKLDTSIETV